MYSQVKLDEISELGEEILNDFSSTINKNSVEICIKNITKMMRLKKYMLDFQQLNFGC